MLKSQRRTWAEVNLSVLEHNYIALSEMLPRACRFMGVVKADAYGHGAVPVAKRLEALGADYLGVACLDEAIELRAAGLRIPILILGYTPSVYAAELLRHDITQTVFDISGAAALSRAAKDAGKKLKVHIKIDTGMSRLGIFCGDEDSGSVAEQAARICAMDGLFCEGIFTHFSAADTDEEFTMLQLGRFLSLLDVLNKRGIHFAIRHCANSAAVLNYPCTHMDMVRPGIALYGHYPVEGMEPLCSLMPVMELKTRIADVKALPAGASVSYGRTHILHRDSRLAVLPVGYADGFSRLFSDKLEVLIHGKKARLAGRVCMDLCMADVTDIPNVKQGDVAVLYGSDGGATQSIEVGAGLAGTISYELLCSVSQRIPRIYL